MTVQWDKPIEAVHEDRFRAKVDVRGEADCWPWTAGVSPKGYGQFQLSPTQHCPATHVALALDGRPRVGRALALHSCDNPACVNPAHLRWGTAAENAADRDGRDRFTVVRGENRTQAKLTDQAVLNILRDSRGYGETAKAYGVSRSLIRNIRTGKAWRHVTGL